MMARPITTPDTPPNDAFVIQHLVPVMIQSSPSLTALVLIEAASEPAFGSEKP